MVVPVDQQQQTTNTDAHTNTRTEKKTTGISEESNLSKVIGEARTLINSNIDSYIRRLSEAIAIPSVSTDLDQRQSCFDMATLVYNWTEQLGGKSEKVLVGFQELDDGQRYDLPPVILSEFHVDNKKPTILVYSNYDISLPSTTTNSTIDTNTTNTKEEDDIFKLVEDTDEILSGCGISNDKANLLSWLWAIEALQTLDKKLPCNLKFIIEGMKHSNSECLKDLLLREQSSNTGFLNKVDYILYSSGHLQWFHTEKPALIYGMKGNISFDVSIKASDSIIDNDWSGTVAEPMKDLIQILAELTNNNPQLNLNQNLSITEEEKTLFKNIKANANDMKQNAGNISSLIGVTLKEEKQQQSQPQTPTPTKEKETNAETNTAESDDNKDDVGETNDTSTNTTDSEIGKKEGDSKEEERDEAIEILINRWKLASISVNSIETNTISNNNREVIPGMVSAKVNVKLSDDHGDGNKIEEDIRSILRKRFEELGSGNEMTITSWNYAPWCMKNIDNIHQHDLIQAGMSSMLKTYGVRPDLIRYGGNLPVVSMLKEVFAEIDVDMMILPLLGGPHKGNDSQISRKRYISSINVILVLLLEIDRIYRNISDKPASKSKVRRGAFGRLKDIWYGLS